MIGGRVEDDETPMEAAIRECHEELGDQAIFDSTKLQLVMEFDEMVRGQYMDEQIAQKELAFASTP